ncbi:aminoacyl-tRNA hydrolase [uncultured Imperialibacter sp.]|uniref:aminoacyl-tRNA hydrolase n=1 Tax=Imperialibacter sp. TaxID=2038411 RepID=UPI0030D74E21|tara:strand:+ start:40428 stop:40988 length:561 start_codon:yes stop_codon:yes gene_type:complete
MKYLIAGLGNIGPEYELTRHNIGFLVLDRLAQAESASFTFNKQAYTAEIKHKGRTLHLIKPTTYMNLSGKAVAYWMQQLKVPRENILVITDDIALPFGKLRMKPKGSSAGHNGLKNIEATLGGQDYARLRFGIGDNYSKGHQVEYVLNNFSREEMALLPERMDKSIDMILSFAAIGIERTMNFFNE